MKVLRMRQNCRPVFDDVGDLRTYRDNHEAERFVEGILRTKGEMPLTQFIAEHPEFSERDVLNAAERLPSVRIVDIGATN